MEQTMGKRIAHLRKGLGLTQDALAEKLGVTAQAVSKWENDLSCPDISMLPRLADIFSVTTDELLGVEQRKVYEGQVEQTPGSDGPEITIGDEGWKMSWNGGRKSALGLALWVLLTGGLLLLSNIMGWNAGLWELLWPTALLTWGVFGLWPRFSFLRLGFALVGGYYTVRNLGFAQFTLDKSLLLPVLLLLLGMSLLADALKKDKKKGFHFSTNGEKRTKTAYTVRGNRFDCDTSFAERNQRVVLPVLEGGSAQSSFAELQLDLTGCGSFAPDCILEVACSFGEMEILLPRDVRADQRVSTSCGSVDTEGMPDPAAEQTLNIVGSVSFGEITVKYI